MPEDLARDPMRPQHAPRFRHPSAGVVRYREHFDYDRARQILFVTMEMSPRRRAPRVVRRAARAAAVFPARVGGAAPLQRLRDRACLRRFCRRAVRAAQRRHGACHARGEEARERSPPRSPRCARDRRGGERRGSRPCRGEARRRLEDEARPARSARRTPRASARSARATRRSSRRRPRRSRISRTSSGTSSVTSRATRPRSSRASPHLVHAVRLARSSRASSESARRARVARRSRCSSR